MGNGEDILATTDPWLRTKYDCCVEQNNFYAGRSEKVASLFTPGEKKWNTQLIKACFLEFDANAILSMPIPQREIKDKVAWMGSNNGVYSAKSGYRYWFDLNHGNSTIQQNSGWKLVWNLPIPHKVKVFVWRFCRNTIAVRKKLSSRGIRLPISCPMCMSDIEHMSMTVALQLAVGIMSV